jgi:hypothetical protein
MLAQAGFQAILSSNDNNIRAGRLVITAASFFLACPAVLEMKEVKLADF